MENQEEWYVDAEALAGLGRWTLDLVTGDIERSSGATRVLGSRKGQGGDSIEAELERLEPDDRRYLKGLLRTARENPLVIPQGSLMAEIRYRRDDGQWRRMRVNSRVSGGARPAWAGTMQDVTERSHRGETPYDVVSRTIAEHVRAGADGAELVARLAEPLGYELGGLWALGVEIDEHAEWRAPAHAGCAIEPGILLANAASALGLRGGLVFRADRVRGAAPVLALYRREPSGSPGRDLAELGAVAAGIVPPRARRPQSLLSAREIEVLRLAADGSRGPEIAERLFVSPATVKTHFSHIYEKLGVADRAAAVAWAMREELIR